MAGGKEIRTQISSIKNTQKITSAMEMVAASKMKKAQDRMLASRPYSEKIAEVIGHLAYAHSEFEHPYMKEIGDVKCVGIIIISSDRGLCGGLNTNLFRSLLKTIVDYQAQGIDVELCTIGKKATSFFKNTDLNIKSVLTDLGDAPQFDDLLGTVKVMLDAYDAGEIQQLSVAYNKFVFKPPHKPLSLEIMIIPTHLTSPISFIKKATSFFKNTDLNIKSVLTDLGDAPQFDDLLGTIAYLFHIRVFKF
jgi:F-type H+-transporting ATPase subunit gamma